MPALSYSHGTSLTTLLGETIGDNLRKTMERFPDQEALVVRHQNYRATYSQLWKQVDLAARALLVHGVEKGDRVGIWSPNRYEWVVTQYATARIGAILVNINPAYKTSELEYALTQSGVSLLIHARAFRQSDYVGMVAQIRGNCSGLKSTLVIDEEWDGLLEGGMAVSGEDLTAREGTLQFDDPINIQYTSGTTGFPKGATLSHHNILNNGFLVGEVLNYDQYSRVCIPVPFYHCFGMVLGNLGCTTHGSCIVVPSEAFDPEAVLETVQSEKVTSLYGVPTMFIAELNHPRFAEFDLSSLRTGIMAGAPCPVEVMRKVIDQMHMEDVTIGCGMTETSPISTQTLLDDPIDKRVATIGKAHPHVEIKIVDPATGAVVPRGVAGEQCTRGYNVMLGYWNNEEATAKTIDEAGWMHTGDLATMDDEGYVSIVGRIKDMIIRGGENIYPREVEEFLYTIEGVADAQVIGIPSEVYGEEVMAWVKLKEGANLSGEDLAAQCKGRISTFKIPKYWKFVDSFPMTVTGKIQKFKMRELAVEELGLS